MEVLYEKYENIKLCMNEFRNYTLQNSYSTNQTEYLTIKEFEKNIRINSYILHTFLDKKNKKVDIYLFDKNSKFIKTTQNFKELLNKYKKKKIQLIFFTKELLSIYIKKAIKTYKNISYDNYLHKHFIIDIRKGPLCSKHEIMSKKEVQTLWYWFKTHPHHLQAIHIDDPQVIWLGAKINNIIKITSISEISGICINYRVVTPKSGKIIQLGIEEEEIDIFSKEEEKNKLNVIKDDEDDDDENYEIYQDKEKKNNINEDELFINKE